MDVKTHNKLTILLIELSKCAANLALSSSWKHEPLFGIMSEKYEWAIAYQKADAEIREVFSKLS